MARVEEIPMDESVRALAEAAAALHEARAAFSELRERIAETRRRTEELVALHVRDLETRVAMGGFTGAKLLADALALDGSPTQRMRVRRIEVGDPVARAFRDWIGVTRCASEAEDTRRLWDQLLAREAQSDGVLRGERSTVLDIPDAIMSVDDMRTLRVSMSGIKGQGLGIVAVPRFTYATPPRKLRNFGHWLVDCVPQAAVLATVAPDALGAEASAKAATILLPGPLKPFQKWALLELGLREDQLVPWDGSAVSCERLLVFESDGRAGGGRPLSALLQLRSRLRADAGNRGTRRIYVSRRDARNRRRWVGNQAEIEAVFRSRGFEVLSMAECPLDEQARIFREARIVAGISGAGLTNLIFSAPGTHAIVLLSDSLIRWYAESGSRSLWARGVRGGPGQLAALGDSPRFYAHLAAAFEQVSHYFVGGDEMPMEELSEFLDAALASADA